MPLLDETEEARELARVYGAGYATRSGVPYEVNRYGHAAGLAAVARHTREGANMTNGEQVKIDVNCDSDCVRVTFTRDPNFEIRRALESAGFYQGNYILDKPSLKQL